MHRLLLPLTFLSLAVGTASTLVAGAAQEAILGQYRGAAAADFSAERGKAFFFATHTGGKPDTPSCTTCHGSDPMKSGKTRAGKEIAPMALSKTPDRYSDPAKVEKWFGRNCESVLGRACTADEKGDFLAFMMAQ